MPWCWFGLADYLAISDVPRHPLGRFSLMSLSADLVCSLHDGVASRTLGGGDSKGMCDQLGPAGAFGRELTV
jgi:hypothetical protein